MTRDYSVVDDSTKDVWCIIKNTNGKGVMAEGHLIKDKQYVSADGRYFFVPDRNCIVEYAELGTVAHDVVEFDPMKWPALKSGEDYFVNKEIDTDALKSLTDKLIQINGVKLYTVKLSGPFKYITLIISDIRSMGYVLDVARTICSGAKNIKVSLNDEDSIGAFRVTPQSPDKSCTITLQFENSEDVVLAEAYISKILENKVLDYPEEHSTYLNNSGKKSYQWELWQMCNNLCKFCYLGDENRKTNKERQMKSLNEFYNNILNLDTNIYNNVSIIGGEFFQGQLDDPDVKDLFMKCMWTCADYYRHNRIGSVWLTVTLTDKNQDDLYEMLDMIGKMGMTPKPEYGSSGLWLCTSWDAEGRFHNKQAADNWDYHMKKIQREYPWVKFNTTIILMSKFIQMYIDGEWSPKKFMEEYKTCLFYKQGGLGTTQNGDFGDDLDGFPTPEQHLHAKGVVQERFGFDFFPTRENFLKFLRKYATEDPETYDRLFNIAFRADELHRNFNEGDSVFNVRFKDSATETSAYQECAMNRCGHILNYAPYIDSTKCCICDRNHIWNSVHGEED